MKPFVLIILALAAPLHAENLFSNGDMNTAGGWKGSKKIVKEDEDGKENRMLVLEAKKRDRVSFHQEVDTKDALLVTVKFRYRTKNYSGLGLELRGIRRGGGFTYSNRDLVADGQWHDVTWKFNQILGNSKIDFSFILLQGEGEVFFDDFSAEVVK